MLYTLTWAVYINKNKELHACRWGEAHCLMGDPWMKHGFRNKAPEVIQIQNYSMQISSHYGGAFNVIYHFNLATILNIDSPVQVFQMYIEVGVIIYLVSWTLQARPDSVMIPIVFSRIRGVLYSAWSLWCKGFNRSIYSYREIYIAIEPHCNIKANFHGNMQLISRYTEIKYVSMETPVLNPSLHGNFCDIPVSFNLHFSAVLVS